MQQLVTQALKSIVVVDAWTLDGGFIGSGWTVAAGGMVLTNAHVVEEAYRLVAVDSAGIEHPAQLVGLDDAGDIAEIHVDDFDAPPLRVENSAPPVATPIWILGNPGGNHPQSVLTGQISNTSRESVTGRRFYHGLFQLDTANGAPGDSGSPVLTGDGAVVAMIALGDNRDSQATNFSYAIAASKFAAEAARWAAAAKTVAPNPSWFPWDPDPKRIVILKPDLATQYEFRSEGSLAVSGSSASDEVTFTRPDTSPPRTVRGRSIVFKTRDRAKAELDSEFTTVVDRGGQEIGGQALGDVARMAVESAGDGSSMATLMWTDRNVLMMIQVSGLPPDEAVKSSLGLAGNVIDRLQRSPRASA